MESPVSRRPPALRGEATPRRSKSTIFAICPRIISRPPNAVQPHCAASASSGVTSGFTIASNTTSSRGSVASGTGRRESVSIPTGEAFRK